MSVHLQVRDVRAAQSADKEVSLPFRKRIPVIFEDLRLRSGRRWREDGRPKCKDILEQALNQESMTYRW
jgi:hypothetical protein